MAIALTQSAPAPNPKAKPTVVLAETILPYEPVVAVEPYVAYESLPLVHNSYVLPGIYADDYYYHPHVDIVV